MDIPKIENSFHRLQKYPTVRERYYKCFQYDSSSSVTSDHCILLHSNKICLVTIASSHPIIRNKKKISRLDFQVSDKLDRLENKVIGKGKKGGQFIKPDSILCFVNCQDGTKYPIYGCISGKLIEINEKLLDNCNLISEKPLDGGYVAIILPSKKDFNIKNCS